MPVANDADSTATDPPEIELVEQTFLFADIEGSTPLWERDPELMSRALLLHDEIVLNAVERHTGIVVKHTGDGILGRFDRSADAVDAATSMQSAMRSAPWPVGFELRIRVGMHHGQAEARANDFYGRDVNLAARVMTAATGGQILMTERVRSQLDDVDDRTLRDEGSCALKGISQPVRLWTVLFGDPDDAPAPVARIGAGASTIPVVPDDLIGRTDELTAVAAMLETNRLVTLTGAPGSGKTRLAIEVANQAVPRNPGGVHVVELAAESRPVDIAAVVADAVLGPEPIAGADGAIDRLNASFSDPVLFVLDNCEHVIDDVASFASAALRSIPTARLLLTSREPLLSPGEQLIDIAPLDVENGGAAVQLFLQRARTVRADITDFDIELATELCARLDGLPLAIELAAARLDVLDLDELSARLFEVLASSRRSRRRTQNDRHATIDTAVRWSWDLLDDDERRVLARASVFVGSFDLDAATHVCGDDELDPIAVIDLLGSLQDRSFISSVWEESGNRFRLLEIVRSFAAAQLDDDETGRCRRRHQDHYAGVSSQLAGLLDAKPDPAVIAQIELDDANFASALHLTDGGAIRTARKIVANLHTYWEETGRLPEGFDHVQRLVEPPDPRSGLWRTIAGLEVTYAAMVGRLGDVERAEIALEELAAAGPDPTAIGAYFALGFANLGRGAMAGAASWFETAADVVAPFDGDTHRQALVTEGACRAYDGDPVAALQCYERARDVPPPAQGWFDDYVQVFDASARVQTGDAANDDEIDRWCRLMHDALVDLEGRELGFRVTVAAHQAALAFAIAERRELFDRWATTARRMAHDNGHRWAVALGVELAGWGCAWDRDDRGAVRHWAVADATFAQAGYGLSPAHRAISDPLRAATTDRLGPEVVASVRAEAEGVGLALHLDQFDQQRA